MIERVYEADCLDWMDACEDDAFDVCITDPPYDEHTHSKGRRGATGYPEKKGIKAQISRNRDLGFDPMTPELRAGVAAELARLVRRWSLVFSSHEDSMFWKVALETAGLQYIRTMVWIKRGATPQFTGDRPAIGHECVVVAHRPSKKRWNGGGKHGVYQVPIVLSRGAKGEQRVHTTQKPLALMEALVRDFSEPGELVVDPFAGSGTTLVAARRLGRRAVGCEIDPTYAELAQRRLEETHEQQELFQ